MPWTAIAGTLAFWVGAICAIRGLWLAAILVSDPKGLDRRATTAGLAWFGALTLATMLVHLSLLRPTGPEVPIVWPSLAVQIWPALLCAVFAVVSLVRLVLAPSSPPPTLSTNRDSEASPNPAARSSAKSREGAVRWLSPIAWAVASVLFLLLPRANPKPVDFIVGKIQLSAPGVLAIVAALVVAVVAMVWSAKSAQASRVFSGMAKQMALLAGTLVFGLPFLFLLVTSFKEDKDMSSPDGIVWVPRVVQTEPVLDDEYPYYEATYKGVKVQADGVKNPDGTLTLTIARPAFYGGYSFVVPASQSKRIPRDMPIVLVKYQGKDAEGVLFRKLADGRTDVQISKPAEFKGRRQIYKEQETTQVRPPSLRWRNFVEALEYLPPEAKGGLTYFKNSLWLVLMNVLGAIVSSSLVAYAFARLKFPGKEVLFKLMLSTMMLPAAVTLLPQFLIFREFGWINTLKPLWVTAWFGSAFNIFLMRQFFEQVPFELEDAAKIDGCSYLASLWSVMLPQVKPALAVIAIMTFMGTWNNFMGPLVYSSSPETLPVSYAVQLFNGERNGEPGLLMAFVTMSLAPVIALFAFAQRFFIEGVTLSGLGGR